jgi:uncharacterized protein involved in type VI secretion and phage assembly
MNLFELLADSEERESYAKRISGVVVGVVTNNQDPDGLGRVKVTFPWLSDNEESFWARVAAPMAGNDRGLYFLPEVQDEVLVAFEHGDPGFPYVLGALWNGKDKPPANNGDGKNDIRTIKSRSGHVIHLDDSSDAGKIEIIDSSGKNKIIIDTANNKIEITSSTDIILSATGGTIKLNAQKIEINSSADTKVVAEAGMDIKASGVMNIKGAMVNIN